MLPNIIEKNGRNTQIFDIPTKLLADRIVYLGSEITSEVANDIIMQMLWLNSDNPDEDINFYINSPGGEIYNGVAIKDIMYKIDAKVNTIGLGICASMGSYLLAAGTGVRKATENCRIMVHSVSGNVKGDYHDVKVDFMEMKYLQNKMLDDMVEFSKGQSSLESLEYLTNRDKYLNVEEAIFHGFIDSKI